MGPLQRVPYRACRTLGALLLFSYLLSDSVMFAVHGDRPTPHGVHVAHVLFFGGRVWPQYGPQ